MKISLAALLLIWTPFTAGAEEKPMTNADVVMLVQAKLGAELVIAKVQRAPQQSFDLSTDGLLSLKKSKVPDEVIAAMMKRQDSGSETTPNAQPKADTSAPEASGKSAKRESLGSRIFRIASLSRSAGASDKCPPAGTFVEFSKVTTPGVAEDYAGCDVTTVAEFFAMGTGNFIVQGVPTNAIAFRALSPGGRAERNPLSGEGMANFVSIEKSKAELLYSLKPGEKIKLRGGTFVSKTLIGGHTNVVFQSEIMERTQ